MALSSERRGSAAGPADPRRGVKSFVLRQGRLTAAQRRAVESLYPRFSPPDEPLQLDFAALFGRQAPLWFELGFGNGATLADLAEQHPQIDLLGTEVHAPGVGHLLHEIQRRELVNLRVVRTDAVELLRRRIAGAVFDRVLVLFPDPWPKQRHRKRRLIQPDFVDLLASRIKPGGILHLATDWAEYGVQMARVVGAHADFELDLDTTADLERPGYRRRTRFEARGLRLGHSVRDLQFRRREASRRD